MFTQELQEIDLSVENSTVSTKCGQDFEFFLKLSNVNQIIFAFLLQNLQEPTHSYFGSSDTPNFSQICQNRFTLVPSRSNYLFTGHTSSSDIFSILYNHGKALVNIKQVRSGHNIKVLKLLNNSC